jgi:hypothetical protein
MIVKEKIGGLFNRFTPKNKKYKHKECKDTGWIDGLGFSGLESIPYNKCNRYENE